jgi:hypothetical protein
MAFLGEPHVSIKSECTVSWGSTPLPIQDYIASAVEAREIPSPHLPCSATGAITYISLASTGAAVSPPLPRPAPSLPLSTPFVPAAQEYFKSYVRDTMVSPRACARM